MLRALLSVGRRNSCNRQEESLPCAGVCKMTLTLLNNVKLTIELSTVFSVATTLASRILEAGTSALSLGRVAGAGRGLGLREQAREPTERRRRIEGQPLFMQPDRHVVIPIA